MSGLAFFGLAVVLIIALGSPNSFAVEETDTPKRPLLQLFTHSKYKYHLRLPEDERLRKILKEELDSQKKTNSHLKQLSSPARIARYQKGILYERLAAEGYYDADVSMAFEDNIATFHVKPMEAYRVKRVEMALPENITVPPDVLGLVPDQRLQAQNILDAEKVLRRYLESNYCLYQIDTSYKVVLETQTKQALVTFSLVDSPEATFGQISLNGLETLDSEYVKDILNIKSGQCFQRSAVDSSRLQLLQSNLLSGANVSMIDPTDGQVAVNFDLQERHHKTIGFGLGFQSDNGFGVSTSWEHRNLLSRAERLDLDLLIAQRFQRASASFRKPQFLRDDQSLTLFSELERETTDAFDSEALETGVEVSRQFGNYLLANLGAEVAFSRIEENDLTEEFALFSVPLSLAYDRRNDPLNPTRGWAAAAQLRPFLDISSTDRRFLRSSIALSGYHTREDLPLRPTFAARFASGVINGESRDAIPANLRFFSGGGGSVRGYAFQALGPFDEQEDPAGGLSFTEISLESRVRFGESWGAVAFLDGGFAFADTAPGSDEELLWGAGVGVRYYTSFAPIRFDIGVPLQRRDEVDDAFQIYISIGQSF